MRIRRGTRQGLVIALLGLVATLLVPTSPAQASSTILCQGFTGCQAAGYSSFGYGPNNYRSMWWRMYSGHNCTNYMAYRMIQAGMPSTRPWSGSGDARNWGVVFKDKTNQTPMIGSVAWWSSNHVAYVQQIVDANTIIISEDHYRGDFDWRRITRSGGGWPTGFIHLVDESVKATAPPTIVGTPQVDAQMVVKPGTWNKPGTTFKYQWVTRSAPIPGATGTTYTPTADQLGNTFAVRVTATKTGYKSTTSNTAVTAATAPGLMKVSGRPVVSGIAKVAGTLTAQPPTWAPAQTATRYAWLADGVVIPGENTTSLTIGPDLLGKAITFAATASRAGYTLNSILSAPTAAVLPEKLAVTEEPKLAGSPYVGIPLSVSPGAATPAATAHYQWLKNGVAIPKAVRATYTPTGADVSSRLAVRVSWTRPGYTTVVRDLPAAQLVRSIAAFRPTSVRHRTLTVTMKAEGVDLVKGQVTLIAPNGRDKKTLTLKNGKVTFAPSWIKAGTRTFTISYLGSNKVHARTITRSVTVS